MQEIFSRWFKRQKRPPADAHQLNLRALQGEALEALYLATSAAGFALLLLAFQFSHLRTEGLMGIALFLLPLLLHRCLARRYLADAWALVLVWLAAGLALTWRLPGTAAHCLLALPAGLATLLISPWAGIAANAGSYLALALLGVLGAQVEGWLATCALFGGILFLAWMASRPLHQALRWSWEHYALAQSRLDRARDTQAELKQAIKDLDEARLQTARLNQLLSAARRAAEEAERAKANFVANVSHELRTPLNMILGFADMIVNAPRTYGKRLPPALLADVAAIQRNSQHLASLINDVLDLSQVEAHRMTLNREWISLAEIVEAAVTAVQPLFASRGLYLRADLPADLPLIYCDRTRIRQVLLNLLNNAARFTEQGGVQIGARREEEQIVVTVTDTGPGIAEEDLPKLFQPFQQLDSSLRRRQGGSGLGLNISRRFVELHGGRMGVHSKLGRGSTFWFNLPLEPPSLDTATFARWVRTEWEPQRRSTLTPKTPPVPRVIIVEPQEMLGANAKRYLDTVELVAATTPAEALVLLAKAPAQVILVRGETAEQTTSWVDALRDAPYATPVVAFTLPTQDLRSDLGIRGYLFKPITREQLFQAIAELALPVRNILLADDDPEALQLFTRILSSGERPYQVLQATNGQEALELLRARRPDLLLLDLVMPGMDGFAVLEAKNRDEAIRDIPTLILSALDPAGQPIIVPSFNAMRSGGGLSLVDFLRCALALSEVLAASPPGPGPTPSEGPGG